MSPANAASILSRIQDWIESLLRCCDVEGAKISMSRWSNSHQKGAEVALQVVVVYDVTMALMMDVCRLTNDALLRPFSKCRQVVRKSGGS